jgi:hypothetical protein
MHLAHSEQTLTAYAEDLGALMKLQQILTRAEVAALVLFDPICKRTVEIIKASLSRHSLKGRVYSLIEAAESAVLEGR